MGYSNNKWRKILTILMIINLCFILFAKFSKIFASSSPSLTTVTLNNNDYDLDLTYLTSQYNYSILCWRNVSGGIGYYYTYLDLYCSDEQMTFYKDGSNRGVIAKEGSDLINFHVFRSSNSSYSYDNAVSTWNNTVFDPSLNDHTYTNSSGINVSQQISHSSYSTYLSITLANFDVKDQNNNIIFNNNVVLYPFFDNVTEIENGNPDGVFISPADYSNNDNLYFHLLEITTGLSNSDNSIYYYNDKTFVLNKDSDYYRTWYDPNIDGFYYYIPRYKLGLTQDTSYLYVLNNSKNTIDNSYGLYAKDTSNGIYDVVQSDTAGVITATEEESDRMKNIEESLIQNQDNTNTINDTLNNTTITQETETDINGSLNFNNQNEGLNSLNNGFFTRLTTILSDIIGYDLSEDTSVSIPLPNSNQSIVLHSINIHNNITGALRLIINAFWVYIFSFYLWRFINKIYIAVTTGHILDTFSSSGEAITNDML